MGFQVAIPPNLKHAACYQQAQNNARISDKGVWRTDYFFQQATDPLLRGGFTVISGRVEKVTSTKKSRWIDLQGQVALRVPNTAALQLGRDWDALVGKSLVVSGWLIKRESTRYKPYFMTWRDQHQILSINE